MDSEIVKYVEQNILPQYEAFTDGHDRAHVEMVIRESLHLAQAHGADEAMAYVIAAYHDLGIPQGRKTHHLTSAALLAADEQLRKWFTPNQLQIMKEAVEDHRASAKAPPRTLYGSIAADADHYIVPEDIVQRTMLYGRTNFPGLSNEEQIIRTREHIVEKFCDGGYLSFHLGDPRSIEGLNALRALAADEARFADVCRKYL